MMMMMVIMVMMVMMMGESVAQVEYNETTWEAFRAKTCLNPIAIEGNPYETMTMMMMERSATMRPPEGPVCAISYQDDTTKSTYIIQTWENYTLAEEAGWYVTHETPCGACSTTVDLSIYMEKPDLTTPGIVCGLLGIGNESRGIECFQQVGLTYDCAKIWYYNTVNSREKCLQECIASIGQPSCDEDGNLNDCLQCDEDESGPIFKEYAGRTRRNSGLESSICRDDDEIVDIYHFYY
jgi:hypothetical protein